MHWIVGIDEAGRGPLAGPVAVGVVKVPGNFDWASKLPGVHDSKQLSELKRETIFTLAQGLQRAGELDYAVAMVGPSVIDRQGIARAIALAMARAICRLRLDPVDCHILLDGSLKAPAGFSQETIIRGDAIEPSIGLASIMAKVTRDRYMIHQAGKSEFSMYSFGAHKGYGTKAHCAAIARFGISTMHRKTYCQNIISTS